MKDGFFTIVNRNHQRRIIMDRIERELYYARLANRLREISARRKKE